MDCIPGGADTRKTKVGVVTRSGHDSEEGVGVNVGDVAKLRYLIILGVLDDTEGIDPEILEAKLFSQVDGVGDGLGNFANERVGPLELILVLDKKGEFLRSDTPDITE